MALDEMSKEVIEDMKRYTGRVARKGIEVDLYHLKCHQAYALYDVAKIDHFDALVRCFEYGFAKGIQAERNRLKKA